MAIGIIKPIELTIATGSKVRGGNRPVISAPQPKSPELPLNWEIRLPTPPPRSVFLPQPSETPVDWEIRLPIPPPVDNPNRVIFGNFSNTKNTGNNRNQNIIHQKNIIIDKHRLNIGQSIQNNAINTLTGLLKSDTIPIVKDKVIAVPNNDYVSFAQAQLPRSINANDDSIDIQEQNILDLQYKSDWDWFNGNGEQYIPIKPPTGYDTCTTTWVCIQNY